MAGMIQASIGRFGSGWVAALLTLAALAPDGGIVAAAPEPPDAVTTTVREDWLPNVPPRALDREAVVEAGLASRTPSAILGVYDLEGDAISVASFTQAANGTVSLNDDGTFTYRSRPGFVGGDEFTFVLADARGARSQPARMRLTVVLPGGRWASSSFRDLQEMSAGGQPIRLGRGAVSVRAWDGDGDGKFDLLAAADGEIWWYRNIGSPLLAALAAGRRVQAGGKDVSFPKGRLSLALADMDGDRRADLVVVAGDRKVYWLRRLAATDGQPAFAAPAPIAAQGGGDYLAADVRADVADWNGDSLPDLLTGTWSGAVRVAYNTGRPGQPAFAPPVEALDSEGLTVAGSYNLNVRVADLNHDGVSDLVESYNWGTIRFRLNAGTSRRPRLTGGGTFSVAGPGGQAVNLHALTDGPACDFADLNGDGALDLLIGCERGGAVRVAWGRSALSYLREIAALVRAHKDDLGAYLADPSRSAQQALMQTLQAALYDYVVGFATPSQKRQIARELIDLVRDCPQCLSHQSYDLKKQPGLASLGPQMWLTLLLCDYDNPAHRQAVADAARMGGAYRKLLVDLGLIYADNARNPRGAEAIWQWVRTIPREVYDGTCITAADWLGTPRYLVRAHAKNTFNGYPVDGGEYGFGRDARAIIGDRGSENWFMTVVRHEACHDLDAYVRRHGDLNRRWGQTLVLAGGPDMRADPKTGWLSMERTREHFRQAGLWDGQRSTWDAAWKAYWESERGKGWREYGFMRGNIPWFYSAPQESLATQGNQHWSTTEGRIEVAIDRFRRGYASNITEVLFFLDVWSLGLPKAKFYEIDNASRQVISYVKLRRTPKGCIDRIDLRDRCYEFTVDDNGVVTGIVHPQNAHP